MLKDRVREGSQIQKAECYRILFIWLSKRGGTTPLSEESVSSSPFAPPLLAHMHTCTCACTLFQTNKEKSKKKSEESNLKREHLN